MSRNRPRAQSMSKRAYATSNAIAHNRNGISDPFGPGMAESVFNVYDEDDACLDYYDEVVPHRETIEELDPEDLYNGEFQSFHFRHQDELDLETNEERETRLKRAIRRFESAYRRMSIDALKWHYLMEETEENPQVQKMFKDMQMIRKLNGSNRV